MKRKLIITVTIISITITTFAQDNYGSDILDTTINNLKGAYNFTPSGNIKNIRLIFHFILKNDGTGNFNETNDGLTPSSNFSGYEYANYMVGLLNSHIENPCEMHLQPFGIIPIYDPEYRFTLVGTFFWRSTSNYTAGLSTLYNSYAKNTNDCINVFLVHDVNSSGGYVRYLGDNAVWSGIHYSKYIEAVNNNNMWYNSYTQRLINHEIGHCFNLHHTLMSGGGTCLNNYNDYCDDTPTIQDMLNIGEPNPCCWNGANCSNNLMDYNASKCAITPDQLGRIHEELNGDKYDSWINHFDVSVLNICNITMSESYIAETINFSQNCTSVINDGITVFINASQVILHPDFEIKKGGMLIINTNDSN